MSETKYWRVELDKVVRYATYIAADTEQAARAIANTITEHEAEEESVEWLELELFEVDADEAFDEGVLFRPADDGGEE
jgi:hypothetical protein